MRGVWVTGWLGLAGMAWAGPADAEDVLTERIAGFEQGGTSGWDTQVRRALLEVHDADRSGMLDREAEVEAISCGTWRAIDDGVLAGWGKSVRELYGFEADDPLWLGHVLGVEREMKQATLGALVRCGVGMPPSHREAFEPAPRVVGELIRKIGGLEDAGTDRWDAAVQRLLLSVFDSDRSGEIDHDVEVQAFSCEVWTSLDRAVQGSWAGSLAKTYGISPRGQWLGNLLGFSPRVRTSMHDALYRCGLAPPEGTSDGRTGALLVHELPAPGSPSWDDAVRGVLAPYDRDGSGLLERKSELEEVACEVWRAIEQGVARGWGSGIWDVYGLEDGDTWEALAWGIPQTAVADWGEALTACSVVPDPLVRAASDWQVVVSLDGVPRADVSAWEAHVTDVLVQHHDANGNGMLELASEVAAVQCDVWAKLDAAAAADGGLIEAYGMAPEQPWRAEVLGLHPLARSQVENSLRACALGASQVDASELVQALGGLRGGGTARWDRAVQKLLVDTFDASGDGSLNTLGEAMAVPCDVWRTLDQAVRPRWPEGLAHGYGFAGDGPWTGYTLGFGGTARLAAAEALASCAAEAPVNSPAVEAQARFADNVADLDRVLGTDVWDVEVKALMLTAFDADNSGYLDAREELDAVPCAVWHLLEAECQRGWGTGIEEVYGLAPGQMAQSAWLGIEVGWSRRAQRAWRACATTARR